MKSGTPCYWEQSDIREEHITSFFKEKYKLCKKVRKGDFKLSIFLQFTDCVALFLQV
jgi:hypothetical protein